MYNNEIWSSRDDHTLAEEGADGAEPPGCALEAGDTNGMSGWMQRSCLCWLPPQAMKPGFWHAL